MYNYAKFIFPMFFVRYYDQLVTMEAKLPITEDQVNVESFLSLSFCSY